MLIHMCSFILRQRPVTTRLGVAIAFKTCSQVKAFEAEKSYMPCKGFKTAHCHRDARIPFGDTN